MGSSELKLCRMLHLYKDLKLTKFELHTPSQSRVMELTVFIGYGPRIWRGYIFGRQEGVSQQPSGVRSSNFAQCCIYIRSWNLQMNIWKLLAITVLRNKFYRYFWGHASGGAVGGLGNPYFPYSSWTWWDISELFFFAERYYLGASFCKIWSLQSP